MGAEAAHMRNIMQASQALISKFWEYCNSKKNKNLLRLKEEGKPS